ncbi:DUF2892 domain-containing protein [Candidatus Saccharibacteria bacterium]|nr:DUF2892 domain-containing protein [Candidatus Saccharibacteria bacterium]
MPLLSPLLGILFAYVLHKLIRTWMPKSTHGKRRNIDLKGRIIRGSITVLLIVLAYSRDWDPLILFFAGFTLYETLSHWCVLYAALGRDSCPL